MAKSHSRQQETGKTGRCSPELANSLLITTAQIWQRELREEETGKWTKFLLAYSSAAVEYAFDCWQRNGSRFPYLSDIGQLLAEWERSDKASKKFASCGECDEGWIRRTTGRTAGGNRVHSKFGAMERCHCWITWANCIKTGIKPPQQSKHSQEYSGNYSADDVFLLWKIFMEHYPQRLGRTLTDLEVGALLNELDEQRQGA